MGVSFHLIGAMSNDDGACECGRCSGLAGAPHCAPLLGCGEPIGTRRFHHPQATVNFSDQSASGKRFFLDFLATTWQPIVRMCLSEVSWP